MLSTIWAQLNIAYAKALTKNPLEREEGQALVEYALILALIAVLAVGALSLIGTNVTAKLNSIGNSI